MESTVPRKREDLTKEQNVLNSEIFVRNASKVITSTDTNKTNSDLTNSDHEPRVDQESSVESLNRELNSHKGITLKLNKYNGVN